MWSPVPLQVAVAGTEQCSFGLAQALLQNVGRKGMGKEPLEFPWASFLDSSVPQSVSGAWVLPVFCSACAELCEQSRQGHGAAGARFAIAAFLPAGGEERFDQLCVHTV